MAFQCFVEAFCDGWSHKEGRLIWDKAYLIPEILCTTIKHENYIQITIAYQKISIESAQAPAVILSSLFPKIMTAWHSNASWRHFVMDALIRKDVLLGINRI
jgi:hypothetical protein